MKPLHKKLLRDVTRLRGQVITIALVVMCGVASWVSLRATYASLAEARASYYEVERYGDLFVDCEDAPVEILARLTDVTGVARAHATLKKPIRLVMPNESTPPMGVMIGIPPHPPLVDAVLLRRGRLPTQASRSEVLVLESFADAHGLTLGDEIVGVLAGTTRRFRVVGTAISPEFLFAIPPGDTSGNPKRFGVLWADSEGFAALADRTGVFNHVSFRLVPGASRVSAAAEIDRILAPFGGVGARPREEQLADRAIVQELQQLNGMALWTPTIFLAVAAFLLHVVLGRLIMLERQEIAALRALGYTGWEVATHYLTLVLGISIAGAAAGLAMGFWFGQLLTALYGDYFHFPSPPFHVGVEVAAMGILVSVFAAAIGALSTTRRVAALPPAEAMQPPAPPSYRRGWFESSGLVHLLSPAARMGLRQVLRQPGRVAVSVVALSFAVSINVVGRFQMDVLDEFLNLQFNQAMREDVAVTFRRPIEARAVHELANLPGVDRVEPMRSVAIELRSGHVRRERILFGHPSKGDLRRLFDRFGTRMHVPEEGIFLDDHTASVLGVGLGDEIEVRTLEGERRVLTVRVAGVFAALTAMMEYADPRVVDRIAGSERQVTGAVLLVASPQREELLARLRDMPEVLQVSLRGEALARFEEVSGRSMTVMTLLLSFFAAVIAVGVVYNDARVALSSQARELASLRVLGFELREIGLILSGQLAFEVALALAPGMLLGRFLAELIMSTVDPELYRFPVIVSADTYLFAAAVVIAAAAFSMVLVRHRLRKLNLIEVLKTRD